MPTATMEQHVRELEKTSLSVEIYRQMPMKAVLSYDEFINEAVHVVKRRYTEAHPQKIASDYAPVREKVLAFVKEKDTVTEQEFAEFFRLMNEESGRKTSMRWVTANRELFVIRETRSGEKTYRLSKEGLRIHQKLSSPKL
jgi:hypothetical protein